MKSCSGKTASFASITITKKTIKKAVGDVIWYLECKCCKTCNNFTRRVSTSYQMGQLSLKSCSFDSSHILHGPWDSQVETSQLLWQQQHIEGAHTTARKDYISFSWWKFNREQYQYHQQSLQYQFLSLENDLKQYIHHGITLPYYKTHTKNDTRFLSCSAATCAHGSYSIPWIVVIVLANFAWEVTETNS